MYIQECLRTKLTLNVFFYIYFKHINIDYLGNYNSGIWQIINQADVMDMNFEIKFHFGTITINNFWAYANVVFWYWYNSNYYLLNRGYSTVSGLLH